MVKGKNGIGKKRTKASARERRGSRGKALSLPRRRPAALVRGRVPRKEGSSVGDWGGLTHTGCLSGGSGCHRVGAEGESHRVGGQVDGHA